MSDWSESIFSNPEPFEEPSAEHTEEPKPKPKTTPARPRKPRPTAQKRYVPLAVDPVVFESVASVEDGLEHACDVASRTGQALVVPGMCMAPTYVVLPWDNYRELVSSM